MIALPAQECHRTLNSAAKLRIIYIRCVLELWKNSETGKMAKQLLKRALGQQGRVNPMETFN